MATLRVGTAGSVWLGLLNFKNFINIIIPFLESCLVGFFLSFFPFFVFFWGGDFFSFLFFLFCKHRH